MRHCPVHRRCNIQTRAQRKAEFGYSTVDFRPFINAVTSPHTSPELTAANSSHRLHVVSTLETLPSGNILRTRQLIKQALTDEDAIVVLTKYDVSWDILTE